MNPATGVLYVAAEKIAVTDPDCLGLPVTFSQRLFTSSDGGQTFSAGSRIADVTPAFDFGAMRLGPGQYMRTIEFPSLAIRGGTLAVVWNDGRLTGHSHILLADPPPQRGHVEPSLHHPGVRPRSATRDHLGRWWVAHHVLRANRKEPRRRPSHVGGCGRSDGPGDHVTQFPGRVHGSAVHPIIAEGYMGDYLSSVSVGGRRYFAWGDNRDIVTNTLWTDGRHDPDVFFASG